MKKTYSKPDIFFEDFSLSTSIAAGCEEYPFEHSDNCGVMWGQKTIFVEGNTGCAKKVVSGSSEYDSLCYHNPYESYNVFYS